MLFPSNPVRGTISKDTSATGFRLTQDFGPTSLSVEPRVVWPGGEGIPAGTYAHFHRGIDLGNRKCGADVLAIAAGTVRTSYKTAAGENLVVITHAGGWVSMYGHLASRSVSKGAKVVAGQKIGTVGATGNAIGCHLHLGVKSDVEAGENVFAASVGKYRDPWPRLYQNVRVRPILTDFGIRIRNAATTDGDAFAITRPDGRIHRLSDNADLGAIATWRDWDGAVTGGSYVVDGKTNNRWERIQLDGAYRFIATPLAARSAS